MITVTDEDLDRRNPKREVVLSASDEAVLQSALVCYREALEGDVVLYAKEDHPRLLEDAQRTIMRVDHLIEVLA